ncbi:MAG: SPOR domain-containing protein [Halothiobacillaceae bacterium]
MARAPQAARRRSSNAKAVPTGLWVMVGGVILLFVGILAWLGTRPEQPQAEAKTLPIQAPAKASSQEPKAATAQKDVREVRTEEPAKAAKPPVPPPPRYDFYEMLPEQSVGTKTPPPPETATIQAPNAAMPTDMPPVKTDAPATAVKEIASLPPAVDKAKVEPSSAPKVILQVGSFRRYEEADRRKAELALLGYSANVQAANVNGETWHRVKIGPMPDAEARKLRDRLKAVGMNPLLVKQGG